MKNFGIYVHIPFCKSKCSYCSFISKCDNEENIQKYVNFLCEEINLMAGFYKDKKISSIYIGGGTPSFINECHIKTIMQTIFNNFNIEKSAEISIECNPCSTTLKKLKVYKTAGINRISFGVQSLCDDELKVLGRKHNKQQAINAILNAKKAGISNISADLMIGIPNQTKSSLMASLKGLADVGVNHISAYMLMLEEGTELYKKVKNRKLQVATDDECVKLYDGLVKNLKIRGFNRYEISNFAKENCQCNHNINYWDMGEYLGFGVASHSYAGGVRFANSENFEEYYNAIEKLKNFETNIKNNQNLRNFYKSYETLTNKEIIEETIMLGLRQAKGVNVNALNQLGYNILTEKKEIIQALTKQKIIELDGNYLKLIPKHFGVCSAVILELLP